VKKFFVIIIFSLIFFVEPVLAQTNLNTAGSSAERLRLPNASPSVGTSFGIQQEIPSQLASPVPVEPESSDKSSFWTGLIIGAVAGGLLTALLMMLSPMKKTE